MNARASALLALDGAVPASGLDEGVAAHYGDPLGEQRAWERGQGFADLSHLDVVCVSGPDRLTWLHSLLTARLDDLAPGQSREALLLDPTGRIEQGAGVVDDGAVTWLITEARRGEGLASWLDSMRFSKRVEVELATGAWAAIGLPEPRDGVGQPGMGVAWTDPWPGVCDGGTNYAPVAAHPGAAWHLTVALVPRSDLEQQGTRLRAHGARPVGTWALTALRIAAWRPRLGAEVDAVAIPHELDWLRTAVHLHKGCYRGQETVAKVINVGKPPRRLTMLHLDGSGHVLPEAGSPVELDAAAGEPAATVGHVTSVGSHYEDGPIALALLRRSVPLDAPLRVGEVAAAQVEVVARSGESAARPVIDRPRGLGFATRRALGRG